MKTIDYFKKLKLYQLSNRTLDQNTIEEFNDLINVNNNI
jgi:hypothetical protein